MLLQTEQTQTRQLLQELPDQVYSVCFWNCDISDPTLVDLTSNFFVLCTKVKVYIMMHLHLGLHCLPEIIHSGWSLAFMKERVNTGKSVK